MSQVMNDFPRPGSPWIMLSLPRARRPRQSQRIVQEAVPLVRGQVGKYGETALDQAIARRRVATEHRPGAACFDQVAARLGPRQLAGVVHQHGVQATISHMEAAGGALLDHQTVEQRLGDAGRPVGESRAAAVEVEAFDVAGHRAADDADAGGPPEHRGGRLLIRERFMISFFLPCHGRPLLAGYGRQYAQARLAVDQRRVKEGLLRCVGRRPARDAAARRVVGGDVRHGWFPCERDGKKAARA